MAQTSQPLPGRQFTFAFDEIGNRESTNRTSTGPAEIYTSNALNQVVTKENHAVSVSGTADEQANVLVAGASGAAQRQGRYWTDEIAVPNSTGPWRGTILSYVGKAGAGAGGSDLLRVDARMAQVGAATQSFSYDEDGNLLSDGAWDYTWDAENRLIAMETSASVIDAGIAAADARRLEFQYDYLGRRIEKLVRGGWNGSVYATVVTQRRFLYDGWNLIAEYAVSGPSSLVLGRTYAWGLDLGGSLAAAGGVGALLEVTDLVASKAYFPTYDGNGNVAALINAASGALAAAYEYSPFGELLRCEGDYAKENPFRFATKQGDDETGLVYHDRRYYSPGQGRFLGRDPTEEKGGLHLYAYVSNNPVNRYDYLGEGKTRKGRV